MKERGDGVVWPLLMIMALFLGACAGGILEYQQSNRRWADMIVEVQSNPEEVVSVRFLSWLDDALERQEQRRVEKEIETFEQEIRDKVQAAKRETAKDYLAGFVRRTRNER